MDPKRRLKIEVPAGDLAMVVESLERGMAIHPTDAERIARHLRLELELAKQGGGTSASCCVCGRAATIDDKGVKLCGAHAMERMKRR